VALKRAVEIRKHQSLNEGMGRARRLDSRNCKALVGGTKSISPHKFLEIIVVMLELVETVGLLDLVFKFLPLRFDILCMWVYKVDRMVYSEMTITLK
jgi:hypothetical protein